MCNSGSLLHNLQMPPPTAEFLLTSPFFRRTRNSPQSSVRARAGHRPCSVKPAKSTRENFQKDSQLVRRRKDYVDKKFRCGPTHPRVAHSCLSTLGSTYAMYCYFLHFQRRPPHDSLACIHISHTRTHASTHTHTHTYTHTHRCVRTHARLSTIA